MDLFQAPRGEWRRVSPKLATVRRIALIPLPAAVALLAGAGAVVASDAAGLRSALTGLAVLALLVAAWIWRWSGRNARSWGYLEADDDLVVTGGVLFRRLVAVPYGRMQFVDVQAGPLDQRFGIASVTLHTASTETAATIPGLPAAEAARLRDRLTEIGESHGAGL
ncbi:MAG TPA: PH domain-containing protein [Aeromicrobium sp.]|nr:PH domain-containing protein [Aeromicrobium sp.]